MVRKHFIRISERELNIKASRKCESSTNSKKIAHSTYNLGSLLFYGEGVVYCKFFFSLLVSFGSFRQG